MTLCTEVNSNVTLQNSNSDSSQHCNWNLVKNPTNW